MMEVSEMGWQEKFSGKSWKQGLWSLFRGFFLLRFCFGLSIGYSRNPALSSVLGLKVHHLFSLASIATTFVNMEKYFVSINMLCKAQFVSITQATLVYVYWYFVKVIRSIVDLILVIIYANCILCYMIFWY